MAIWLSFDRAHRFSHRALVLQAQPPASADATRAGLVRDVLSWGGFVLVLLRGAVGPGAYRRRAPVSAWVAVGGGRRICCRAAA